MKLAAKRKSSMLPTHTIKVKNTCLKEYLTTLLWNKFIQQVNKEKEEYIRNTIKICEISYKLIEAKTKKTKLIEPPYMHKRKKN